MTNVQSMFEIVQKMSVIMTQLKILSKPVRHMSPCLVDLTDIAQDLFDQIEPIMLYDF